MSVQRDYRKTYPEDSGPNHSSITSEHREKTSHDNSNSHQQSSSVSHQDKSKRKDFQHQLFSSCLSFQCDPLKWTTDRARCEQSLLRDFELLLLALQCSSASLSQHHHGIDSNADSTICATCKVKLVEVRNWLRYYDLLKKQCPSVLVFPHRQLDHGIIEIQENHVHPLPQFIVLLPLKGTDQTGGDADGSDRPPKVLERIISARTSPRPSVSGPADSGASAIPTSANAATAIGDSLNQAWTTASHTVHQLAQVPQIDLNKSSTYLKPPHVNAVKSFFSKHVHTLTGAIPLPIVTFPPVLRKFANGNNHDIPNAQPRAFNDSKAVESKKVNDNEAIEQIAIVKEIGVSKMNNESTLQAQSKVEQPLSSSHWHDSIITSTEENGDSLSPIKELQETLRAFLSTCHEYHNYFKQRVKWIQCQRDVFSSDMQGSSGGKLYIDDSDDFTLPQTTLGLKLMAKVDINEYINQLLRNETFLGLRKEENVTIATMALSDDGSYFAYVTISGKLTIIVNNPDGKGASRKLLSPKVLLKNFDCGRQCPTAIAISLAGGLIGESNNEDIVVVLGFPFLEVRVVNVSLNRPTLAVVDPKGRWSSVLSPRATPTPAPSGNSSDQSPQVTVKSYWLETDYSQVYKETDSNEEGTKHFSLELVSDWINTIKIIPEMNLIVIGREEGSLSTLEFDNSSSGKIYHYDYDQDSGCCSTHMNRSRRKSRNHQQDTTSPLKNVDKNHIHQQLLSSNCFDQTMFSHIGITSMDYSLERQVLVTGSYDGVARIYQLPNYSEVSSDDDETPHRMKMLMRLYEDGHQRGGISTVTISRNGLVVFTGGFDHQVIVWDAICGEKLRTLLDFSSIQQHMSNFSLNSEYDLSKLDRDHYNIRSITLSSEDYNNSLVTVTLQGGFVLMIDNAMTEQHLSVVASPTFAAKDKQIVSIALSENNVDGKNRDSCCYLAVIGGTDSVSLINLHNQNLLCSLSMSSMHFQFSNHEIDEKQRKAGVSSQRPSRLLSLGCQAVVSPEGNIISWSYSTALVVFELRPNKYLSVAGRRMPGKRSTMNGDVFAVNEGNLNDIQNIDDASQSWKQIFRDIERSRLISPFSDSNSSGITSPRSQLHHLCSDVFDVKYLGFDEIENLVLLATQENQSNPNPLNLLIFSDRFGNIGIFNISSHSVIMTFPGDGYQQITALTAFSTGTIEENNFQCSIAFGNSEGFVRFWNTIKVPAPVGDGMVKKEKKLFGIGKAEVVQSAFVSPRSISAELLGSISSWETREALGRHSDAITAVTFCNRLNGQSTPSTGVIFSGSKDHNIMLWDFSTLTLLSILDLRMELSSLSIFSSGVTSLSVCKNSSLPLIVAGYASNHSGRRLHGSQNPETLAVVWNWEEKRVIRLLEHNSNQNIEEQNHNEIKQLIVSSVAISRDGEFIFTGTNSPSKGFFNVYYETLSKDFIPLTAYVQMKSSVYPLKRLSNRLFHALARIGLSRDVRVVAKDLSTINNSTIFLSSDKLIDKSEASSPTLLQRYWTEFVLFNCLEPEFEAQSDDGLVKVKNNCLFFQLGLTSSAPMAAKAEISMVNIFEVFSKMVEACPPIVLMERYAVFGDKRTPRPVRLLTLLLAATKELVRQNGFRISLLSSILKRNSTRIGKRISSRKDAIDPRIVKVILTAYLNLLVKESGASAITYDDQIVVNEICQVARYWPTLFFDFVKSLHIIPCAAIQTTAIIVDGVDDVIDDEEYQEALQSSDDYILTGSIHRTHGVHDEDDENNGGNGIQPRRKRQSPSISRRMFAFITSIPRMIRRQGDDQVPSTFVTPYLLPLKNIGGKDSIFLKTLVMTAKKTRDFSAFDNQVVRLLIEYKWQSFVAVRFTRDFIFLGVWFFLFLANAVQIQSFIPVPDSTESQSEATPTLPPVGVPIASSTTGSTITSDRIDPRAFIYLAFIVFGWLYFLYHEVYQMLPSSHEYRLFHSFVPATTSAPMSEANRTGGAINPSISSKTLVSSNSVSKMESSINQVQYRMPRVAFFNSFMSYLTDLDNWFNLLSYWLVFVSIAIEVRSMDLSNGSANNASTNMSHLKETCAITLPLIVLDLLYTLGGFRTTTAPFIRKLVGISRGIVIFLMLLVFILVAFTGSFMLLLPDSEDYQTYDKGLMQVFTILFGNFDMSDFYASPSPKYAVGLLAVFLFVVIVVLLNLLIALMGDIQQDIESRIVAETYFAQAKIILEYERMLVDITTARRKKLHRDLTTITGWKKKFVLITLIEIVWLHLSALINWDVLTDENEDVYFPQYIHVLAKSDAQLDLGVLKKE